MLKAFKTEISPNAEQKIMIHKSIGVCRYIYNFYLARNKEVYEQDGKFVSAFDFSKWLNNEYLPNNPDKLWIKEVSSKAVKQSILNAETAFKRFFKGQSKYPNFKKKYKADIKVYFVKNSANQIINCERHRIKLPTLGWIKLKEKGYLPQSKKGLFIKSGTISYHAGRYYVSALVDIPENREKIKEIPYTDGIGIDLGIKELAIISNGDIYKNINKLENIKNLEKKRKRYERAMTRKLNNFKKYKNDNSDENKKIKIENREKIKHAKNLQKNILKIQKIHQRITNIRNDNENKIINKVVKTKPLFITIENLNIQGMMKNKHLAKAIKEQRWNSFITKLQSKCNLYGIELRQVDKFYSSSKKCNKCGNIKKDLKLKDRIYKCSCCGYVNDRDLNAALNLRDAIKYTTLTQFI